MAHASPITPSMVSGIFCGDAMCEVEAAKALLRFGGLNKTWMEQFRALQKFNERNGHCRVPYVYPADPSLGIWVHIQRRNQKERLLSDDQKQSLDELGFSWKMSTTWMEHFHELLLFKQKNGHCRVPYRCKENLSLGRWVDTQRQEKKKQRLSEHKEQLLNGLDFEWRAHSKTWTEQFLSLQQFKQERGDCRVPHNYKADPSLGVWVANQRREKKKRVIPEDRERKLNELSFEWSPNVKKSRKKIADNKQDNTT